MTQAALTKPVSWPRDTVRSFVHLSSILVFAFKTAKCQSFHSSLASPVLPRLMHQLVLRWGTTNSQQNPSCLSNIAVLMGVDTPPFTEHRPYVCLPSRLGPIFNYESPMFHQYNGSLPYQSSTYRYSLIIRDFTGMIFTIKTVDFGPTSSMDKYNPSEVAKKSEFNAKSTDNFKPFNWL